ncbi:MAG: lipopolysaccharide transport periplasmic protein LptA [Deltaproteobacteria bacterium]|nr:lipopolysaccharide transport periplasmic protein LptA [Deltaproteobacteria bacterium]
MKLWGYLLCALGIFLISPCPAALAAEAGKAKKKTEGVFQGNKKDPIFITSDRLEVDHKKNTILYTGRVITVQGEMTMRSDSLVAYYSPDMKGLKEVVAEGNVQVTQGERVATGTRAVFNDREQTITLTGNPVVRQGSSQVSGNRITFFVEQERAVVEGGSERVKATLFPEDFGSREKARSSPGKTQ